MQCTEFLCLFAEAECAAANYTYQHAIDRIGFFYFLCVSRSANITTQCIIISVHSQTSAYVERENETDQIA